MKAGWRVNWQISSGQSHLTTFRLSSTPPTPTATVDTWLMWSTRDTPNTQTTNLPTTQHPNHTTLKTPLPQNLNTTPTLISHPEPLECKPQSFPRLIHPDITDQCSTHWLKTGNFIYCYTEVYKYYCWNEKKIFIRCYAYHKIQRPRKNAECSWKQVMEVRKYYREEICAEN